MLKLFASVVAAVALVASVGANELRVGDKAPNFTLKGTDGHTYQLNEFIGKQPVVIAWFPKAFSQECTQQFESFQKIENEVHEFNVQFFAVSCDNNDTNTKFAQTLKADFPLLSDANQSVAKQFGVWNNTESSPYRWVYYIGTDGQIEYIEKHVNASTFGKDVVTRLRELGFSTHE